MFILFMLAAAQNFSIETVRIWHSFYVNCSCDGVLCKILVFVLNIAKAIKPTRKKKRWKKSILWNLNWEILFSSTWIQHCMHNTRCGRKVMRLATLCTNQQCCCLPLHVAVRLTPAVDSVQVWTYYSCYAIVESVWSEVVFVRCITKMDW